MEWNQPRVFRKEFSVTLNEAVQAQKLLAAQRMHPRKRLLVALAVWIFASAFTYVQIGENDHRTMVALIVNVPIPLFLLALFKWLPSLAFRGHYTTHFGPGPYAASVEIGATQLIDRFVDIESRFAWHTVRKLEDHSEALRIYIAKLALSQIPKSVFNSDEEKREWMEALEQKTGLSFS